MAAPGYDADMLTDEMSQIHKSPGFIASTRHWQERRRRAHQAVRSEYGTASDLWNAHCEGKATSFNPMGLVEALTSAICYAEEIGEHRERMIEFARLTPGCHRVFVEAKR